MSAASSGDIDRCHCGADKPVVKAYCYDCALFVCWQMPECPFLKSNFRKRW